MKFIKSDKLIIIIAIISISAIAAVNGYAKAKIATIVDDTGRKVAVHMPIKTFVYHGHNCYLYETLRTLAIKAKVIGAIDRFVRPGGYRYSAIYFPEFLKITNIGLLKSPDYELIDKLKPDVIFSDGAYFTFDWRKTPGIPVIIMDIEPTINLTEFREKVMKLGALFNKEKEAKQYIYWWSKWFNELKERTKNIPEKDRPLVFMTYYDAIRYGIKRFSVGAKDNRYSTIVHMAGGRSIGDEINGSGSIKIDAEWIIRRNPDVIILTNNYWVDYDIKNPSKAKQMIDQFMNRPEFAHVSAVKNKRLYMMNGGHLVLGGANGLIDALYIAKWLYPKRFADMDPQAVHEEFITKFQHLDLDLDKTWCVYPKP